MNALALRGHLSRMRHPAASLAAQRFFKTGPGQYGEGDIFLGITVPVLRRLAQEHRETSLAELGKLLRAPEHECRYLALAILGLRFAREVDLRSEVVRVYFAGLKGINNWDLVDTSAPSILGAWLEHRDRSILDRMAESKNLWERRIAMVSTYHFIRGGESEDALRISKRLLGDREDLIHKAVGWMLREVGKRVGPDCLRFFLRQHQAHMSRTTLRYAIERFSPQERQRWLRGSPGRRSTGPGG